MHPHGNNLIAELIQMEHKTSECKTLMQHSTTPMQQMREQLKVKLLLLCKN